MVNFTTKHIKVNLGYIGRQVEWPDAVTEDKDLKDCRGNLRDAFDEMLPAY